MTVASIVPDISVSLRVILVLGSLLTMFFMLRRIRNSKAQIHDSILWVIFSVALLALSIFPDIATWAARVLGMQAPINVVYLALIFFLLIQAFSNSMRISRLDAKVQVLTQRLAMEEKLREEREQAESKNQP